jgi:hypothetical protein
MMAEAGAPTLLGLFCEVNAGVLATTYAALGVHELTAISDVAYADGRREVTPTEQHVHGFGACADDGHGVPDRLALGPGAGDIRTG